MKINGAILVGVILLSATVALGQNRFELFGEYSYVRFNPTLSETSNRSFNGGGGGVTIYFAKVLGIKAELMGYGSTSFTTTFASSVILPDGSMIPAGTYKAQGNMVTYLAGPVVSTPISKVAPFGELLMGASHNNAYANLERSIIAVRGNISKIPTQHPFTMALGGGLDISISSQVSIRPIEIDYLLSRYSNPLTGPTNQNDFRYCGGIVLKF
jgi:hypothetical protein